MTQRVNRRLALESSYETRCPVASKLGARPPEIARAGAPFSDNGAAGGESDQTLGAVERAHVRRVLASTGHNHTLAARVLGISRSTLNRKLAAWQAGSGGEDTG